MFPWAVDFPLLLAAEAPEFTQLQMTPGTQWLLGGALAVYLVVLTVLSVVATKKVSTEEDYLVAGRNLPLFLCWGTLIATWFGAASMTAASESAREEGLLGVILDPFACAVTLVYAGLMFAGPMWRMKLLTTSDFFRRTYGSTAELVGACIQVPAYFGWIALQYKAIGGMLAVYFGVPVEWGIVIACGVTLAYTMIGGMWSVTLTDTLQISFAFLGLLILAYTAYSQFGGGSAFAGVDRLLTETDPQYLTLIPPAAAAAILASTGAWATGIFGNIPGQDLQQRIFSARDAKTASRACILAGILYFCFGMIPVSLGLISQHVAAEADGDILQIMAGKYLTPALAVIFVVSFTSVVVSTATSAVLAPATILSHNLLGRFSYFRGRGLVLDRLCVFLISMGGLSLAFSGQSKMELLDLALSMQLVALYIPLHMGLYGRPRSQWCALIPMILGISCFMARWLPENVFLVQPDNFQGEYGDYIASLIASLAWKGILRDLFMMPDSLYGLGASLIGYLLAQAIFSRQEPINDQTLKDAWGEDWTRFC
uniref:Sodium:solute symporter n=1 Tax=Schlesneria paludicola TaxID=360056 RepID=A0A7C2K2T8_9PLAN